MKTLFLLPSLLFISLLLSAQTGSQFPDISGNTLEGKEMTIPQDTKNKYTVVGVAYSKKSDDQLKTWFSPCYNTFISPPKGGLFPVDHYDINLWFVPMLTGVYQAAGGKIEKKMKENIDPLLQKYIMVYQGELKPYKSSLGLDSKDEPYFFVIDTDGQIVYSTRGGYTDEKMEGILEMLEPIE